RPVYRRHPAGDPGQGPAAVSGGDSAGGTPSGPLHGLRRHPYSGVQPAGPVRQIDNSRRERSLRLLFCDLRRSDFCRSGSSVGGPVQEGHNLAPLADGVGRERAAVTGAEGDALGHGPVHRGGVVRVSGHVGEGSGSSLGAV
ncbi:Lipoprotein signal peptidase, partial [Dysosmobacter welbionis]